MDGGKGAADGGQAANEHGKAEMLRNRYPEFVTRSTLIKQVMKIQKS